MWSSWVGAFIFVMGVIFTAGGIVYSTRRELSQSKLEINRLHEEKASITELLQTKSDINRLGAKQRDEERAALRRHFNMCLMLVAVEKEEEKRFRIAGQLKED